MNTDFYDTNENMIGPMITEYYALYSWISHFRYRRVDDYLSFCTYLIYLMPRSMAKRTFNAAHKRLINSKCCNFTGVLQKFEQLIYDAHANEWLWKQYEFKIKQAFSSLDAQSCDLLLRQMWIQMQNILEVFEKVMIRKYGTDDLDELFCIDVVKNYRDNGLICQRGTFNVILMKSMKDPEVIKKKIIDLLLNNTKYKGGDLLMESIVQISDKKIQRVMHVNRTKRNDMFRFGKLFFFVAIAISCMNSFSTRSTFSFCAHLMVFSYHVAFLLMEFECVTWPKEFDEILSIAASRYCVLNKLLQCWNSVVIYIDFLNGL